MRRSHPLSFAGLLTCFLLASSACGAQSFRKLVFEPGKQAIAAGYRLQLQEPDNPAHPTLWQGPLSVARGSRHCTVDSSLIRDVYLSATGRLLVVVSNSGSSTFVDFFRLSTCAHRWPGLKAFTAGVSIQGSRRDTRLTLLPACACAAPGEPCSCTAGAIYRLSDNAPPLRLAAASRSLNLEKLGADFTGTRSLAHPPASATP